MVINYNRRPNATIDEKLQSLVENIQLALNEIPTVLSKLKNDCGFITNSVDGDMEISGDLSVEGDYMIYLPKYNVSGHVDKELYDALVAMGWIDL